MPRLPAHGFRAISSAPVRCRLKAGVLIVPPFRLPHLRQHYVSAAEIRIDLSGVAPGRYRVIAVHNFHVEDGNPDLGQCAAGVFLAAAPRRRVGAARGVPDRVPHARRPRRGDLVIANTERRAFDVIEITNELPLNRIGGVGTVIEGLISGLAAESAHALWFLVDHAYRPPELERLLARYPCVAVGTAADLRRFEAPVAHLHTYNINAGLFDALGDTPVLFTVHSLLVEEERSNDVDLAAAVRWQEALLARCDEVAVVSSSERERYRALGYDRLNPRVSVVHNGIAEPPRFRARRGRRTLGFSGRLIPRKRPEYAQMVLAEPQHARRRTYIAGKAFSRYARDLVDELGLDERAVYLGWCGGARLEAFYDAIDALAVPSVYEPFGLAALEAAARGVPVVCTRVDGLVEVLGDAAIYCDGAQYESFRDAMWRWLNATDDQIALITDGARDRARERFTDVAMARRYVQRFAGIAELAHPDETETKA